VQTETKTVKGFTWVREDRVTADTSERVIWRLLMPKTRHHVYYRRNDSDVEVLVVWNAVGKAEPDL